MQSIVVAAACNIHVVVQHIRAVIRDAAIAFEVQTSLLFDDKKDSIKHDDINMYQHGLGGFTR